MKNCDSYVKNIFIYLKCHLSKLDTTVKGLFKCKEWQMSFNTVGVAVAVTAINGTCNEIKSI